MGTNFYLHRPSQTRCSTCGHDPFDSSLHIGKSSYGWCFALHVIPEENINCLEDWKRELSKEGCEIYNEYEEKLSMEELLKIITNRGDGLYTQKGNIPIRHQIDGTHCVAHGEGTYDYIKGEFS